VKGTEGYNIKREEECLKKGKTSEKLNMVDLENL